MHVNSSPLSGDQIQVGRPVPFDCYDSHGHLLLRKGFILESQKQVDFLLDRGLFRQDDSAPPEILLANKTPSPFQLLNDYSNRLKLLLSNYSVESRIEMHRDGKSFSEQVIELAKDIQRLCQIDADALLGKIHLDHSGRYSIIHSMHRAIISELLALRKSISDADRQQLIAAALTSDMSILQLQDLLIRQNGPLLPEQQRQIFSHPIETVKQLNFLGVTNPVWITTVIQHHELLNGKGYPHGLSSANVSVMARILKLADMYTAMISPRAYRKALLNKATLRDILLKRGSEIDEEFAISIVKELGIFPPGAFVRLKNGEIAIVIRRGINPKFPIVKAVLGMRGNHYITPVNRETSIEQFEIHDIIDPYNIVNVDINKLIDFHKLWDY